MVSGESEVPALVVFTRMGATTCELGDLAQIRVENDSAIQLHLDDGSPDGDFLLVPFANRPLVTACGGHPVGRAVHLPGSCETRRKFAASTRP